MGPPARFQPVVASHVSGSASGGLGGGWEGGGRALAAQSVNQGAELLSIVSKRGNLDPVGQAFFGLVFAGFALTGSRERSSA